MLKKIVRDILIVAGIGIMAISTSQKFMQWVSDKRNENEAWWGVHKDVEGDLVGMAYLRHIDKFCAPRDYAFTRPTYPGKKADLYTWGDSYIWKIPDSSYAGIRNYKFGWRGRDNIFYRLDTSQINILVIEASERYARYYFSSTDIYENVKREETPAITYTPTHRHYAAISLPGIDQLFNPYINQNLEYNLFNYNFINPIRYSKASMNYYLFNRASGDVVISNNGKQLFLKETVKGKRIENIYFPLRPGEADLIVNNMNNLYDHYKAEGFDEVYFSIIPSPATILQPEGYSGFIPSVENHPNLRAKTISVYSLFKTANRTIYRPGDTHWNNEGLQIWLSEVNNMLIRHNEAH